MTARGKAFTFGNWDGPVRQHGEPDGVRYRLLSWLNDQKRLVAAASDEGERETLVVLTADGSEPPRRLDAIDTGRIVNLEVSPTANQVVFGNHRNQLFLVDLEADEPEAVLLDSSPFGRLDAAAWSPDGRWVAYHAPITPQTIAIKLCRVETREVTQITRPVLRDYLPAWDPEGKYLYFIGQRDYNPVYDELQFDLNFPMGSRPFAIALRKDVPSPFIPARKAARERGGPGPGEGRGRARADHQAADRDRPGRHRAAGHRVPGARGEVPARPGDQGEGAVLLDAGRGDAHAVLVRHVGAGQGDAGRLRLREPEARAPDRRHHRLLDRPRREDAALPGRRAPAGAEGRREAGRRRRRHAEPDQRLDRPGAGPGLGAAGRRVAADVPRGLAAPARALLGRGHGRAGLGRHLPALPAAGGSGDDPLRAVRPALGGPGRARHVARLRDRRRVPPRPDLHPGPPRRGLGA